MSAFFQDDEYSKLVKRPKLTETCCDENLPCCDGQTGLKIYTLLTECGGSLATHAIEGNFQAGRNVYHTASTDCFYCSGLTTNITGYTEFPIADVVLDGCTCRVTPPPPPLTVTLLTPCGGTSETHYVIGSYLGLYIEDTATNICYYGTNLANTNMTLVGTEITAFTQGTCSCSTPPPPGLRYTILSACDSTIPIAYIVGDVLPNTTTVKDNATSDCYAVVGVTTTLPALTLIAAVTENGCSCVAPPPPPTTYTLLALCGSAVQSAFIVGYFANTAFVRDSVTGACYYVVGYSTTPSGYQIVNNGPNRCSCQGINPAPGGGNITPINNCSFKWTFTLKVYNFTTGQFTVYPINISVNEYNSLNLFGTKIIDIGALIIQNGISLGANEVLEIGDLLNSTTGVNLLSFNTNINTTTALINVGFIPNSLSNPNQWYPALFYMRFSTIPVYGSQVFDYTVITDCQNLNIKFLF